MYSEAFSIIEDILKEELNRQEITDFEQMREESDDVRVYMNDSFAYSVKYESDRKCFELRSTTRVEGKSDEWKSLSRWLFDENSTNKDAESIGQDFLDIISGPKTAKSVKAITKKKKKGEDGNIDPLFLFNRLANIFPEIKEEMNEDRIKFGKIRFATLTKSVVAPNCEKLASKKGEGFVKMCELFNDMYKNGDIEARGLVIHGVFNSLSDEAMKNIGENFSEELQKAYKCSRKLKDKQLKPEKPKKKNKIVAAALENANKK